MVARGLAELGNGDRKGRAECGGVDLEGLVEEYANDVEGCDRRAAQARVAKGPKDGKTVAAEEGDYVDKEVLASGWGVALGDEEAEILLRNDLLESSVHELGGEGWLADAGCAAAEVEGTAMGEGLAAGREELHKREAKDLAHLNLGDDVFGGGNVLGYSLLEGLARCTWS